MELSEPSSSQPSTHQQNILVNAEGKPLKINLQAVELEGRPKLVRTLKGSGALVVSNAKEAAIILVDSATESGKRLIRTWGHDDSKVVLEHTWVRASANLGRPLLEADNWGGAMTVDDGKPVTIDGVVVDEDELEEVEALVTKSPLPTPRVTPVEPTSQRSEITTQPLDVTRLASKPSTSTSNVTEQLPPGLPIAQPTVVNPTPSDQTRMATNPHNDIHPQQSPPLPPSPATQSSPYLQSTMSMQPPQSQNTHAFAPFTPQHPYPLSQSQMMPTQPFPHAGFPPSQLQITHAPSLPHSPMASSQPPATQPAPNMDVIGANLQNPNFATIMTIMEVVRHMDQSSWFGQNQLPPSQFSQPSTNFNTSTFPVQPPITSGPPPSASAFQLTGRFESPGVDVSVPSSQDYLSDANSSSWKHGSGRKTSESLSATQKSLVKSTRRPSDEMLALSTSRKRASTVNPANPPKRPRKGKERAISPYSSEQSEVDESMAVSESSYPTNTPNSPPERLLNIVSHKKRGEIFLCESGQPLRFFVQVDLHGRHAVVANIKKNKGKIVNNIADSDYLILSPRSDTFQGLLNEATALGKSPILAAFVADCVEEDALLDETDYILDSVAKVKPVKRGRQNVFSMQIETSETFSPQIKRAKPRSSPATGEGKRSKGTPSKPLTPNISKKKSTPSKLTVEAREVSTGSRSPTPPPASARREMGNGRYLFTPAEDDYILCYAKHLLNRDPTITNNGLVSKLYLKMPHHTAASWGAHIHVDQKLKGAVEDVRKRAYIAKRKRDSEATTRNLSQGPVNEGTSSKGNLGSGGTNGDVTMHSSEASQESLERQDFEVITKFFALGGGDDDNDERVWQELEKHRPCRSSTSWPEYYAAHQQEVYTRIEEMMNE